MPKYDASALLYCRLADDRFINALNISDEDINQMKSARAIVRNRIKSAFTMAKKDERYVTIQQNNTKKT